MVHYTMTNTPEVPGALMPEELATIERAMKRVADRLVLSQADKEEMAAAALSLYQRGFTAEDQLLEQLLETLIASLAPDSPPPKE
jgi:hypothetical protein